MAAKRTRRRLLRGFGCLALCLVAACTSGGHSPSEGNRPTASTSATAAPSRIPQATGTPVPASSSPASPANPAGLTDAQLVGQLFIGYVYGAGATTATAAQRRANLALYGAATGAEVVRRWHLGGIILLDHNNLDPARPNLSTGNVGDATRIRSLTAGLQAAAVADSGV